MADAAPEQTPEQRLLEVIEKTFRRIKVQHGRYPDIADIRDDLATPLRIEILLCRLEEAQRSPRAREQRVREIIADLALLNFQLFRK
jgi:hypothetical protein